MMEKLLEEIKACKVCEEFLPLGPRPVTIASATSQIIIVGQAPGTRVHKSGIPWDDPSGDLLREWLGVDKPTFYNPKIFAHMPMGFCYPGKGKSGDLPPRPECAPLWHQRLLKEMPKLKLTILIGQYSQAYYLGESKRKTLTETVRNYEGYLPKYLPLPHPSPRNRFWLKKNPWFTEEVLPVLKNKVKKVLTG